LILLFLIQIQHIVLAQSNSIGIQFEKITDQNGRSLGFVTGILQDEYGFMWFATRNGLYRYDGYSYKLFKRKQNDTTSLPFNDVAYMHYDLEGKFWLRHFDRFTVLKTEKIMQLSPALNKINESLSSETKIVDSKENIWFGPTKNGVVRYNKKNQASQTYMKFAPQFHPTTYKIIDSLVKTTKPLAGFSTVGVNVDTIKTFDLQEDKKVLIMSTGEIDDFGKYDYGFLMRGKDTVWTMHGSKSKHSGGNEKNKLQIETIFLKKGSYTLHFISDNTNAFDSWDGGAPNKINFYGVLLYDLEAIKLNNLRTLLNNYKPANAISSDEIIDMVGNQTCEIAFVTANGIEYYNRNTKAFDLLPLNFAKLLGTQDFVINKLYVDYLSRYWIATSNGLLRLNPSTNETKLFQNTLQTPNLLTSNNVLAVYYDMSNNLWVGTDDGLNVMLNAAASHEERKFLHFKVDNVNRLYHNSIWHFFEDRAGNMWIGTQEGLNKAVKSRFNFFEFGIETIESFPVNSSNNNIFWYKGKADTIFGYNRQTSKTTFFTIPRAYFPNSKSKNTFEYFFFDIHCDAKANLWISIDNSLYKYDLEKQALDRVVALPEYAKIDTAQNEVLEINNHITQIFEDKENAIWLIALEKLYKLDAQNRILTDSIDLQIVNDNNFREGIKFIKYVAEDNAANFWFRTTKGVCFLQHNSKKPLLVIPFSDELQETSQPDGNLFVERDGTVWCAMLPELYRIYPNRKTQSYKAEGLSDIGNCRILGKIDSLLWIYSDNGVYAFNEKTKEFRQYQTREGLADNIINGAVDDRHNNIWFSTAQGISKLDKQSDEITNYFRPSDWASFKFVGNSKFGEFAESEIIFFANNGFITYYPDSINKTAPPVVITRFTIFGKDYNTDSLIFLEKKIDLKYNQNFLAFEFAALDFTSPDANRYQYKLDGLDKDWTICDANSRKANYTGLRHGRYVFRVRGTNNDGVWGKEQSIIIIIHPPFWKTTWFIMLEIFTGILLIYLYIKIRERQLRREKRILERKVKERTAEIEKQKQEIIKQRDEIAEQQRSIMDSIHYASRIQAAILPPSEILHDILPQYFILNKPRDIVSGDFYWMTRLRTKNITNETLIVVVADCTGHGVPGAFMSMLGVSFLNEIIGISDIYSAAEILNRLRDNVIKSLHQTGKDNEAKDGMDISLCVVDMTTLKLQFAGAYNSLYIVRQVSNEASLIEIKADRMPIGIHFKQPTFTNNEFDLQKGDCLYMLSDGYVDQIGGLHGRKFMSKNFKALIQSDDCNKLSMPEQRKLLDTTIEEWRGPHEQIDDILVVGLKV